MIYKHNKVDLLGWSYKCLVDIYEYSLQTYVWMKAKLEKTKNWMIFDVKYPPLSLCEWSIKMNVQFLNLWIPLTILTCNKKSVSNQSTIICSKGFNPFYYFSLPLILFHLAYSAEFKSIQFINEYGNGWTVEFFIWQW